MRDRVTGALRDGVSTITINSDERSVSDTILAQPHRAFYMAKKAIFRKAVIAYASILPEPKKSNTSGWWTAPFMEVLDKLVAFVTYQQKFFTAVRKIVLTEMEHDSLYRNPIIAMLEWLIEAVLDGKLEGREFMKPPREYWSEPPPYGGNHSIIYKIRANRKAINDLLGRKHYE